MASENRALHRKKLENLYDIIKELPKKYATFINKRNMFPEVYNSVQSAQEYISRNIFLDGFKSSLPVSDFNSGTLRLLSQYARNYSFLGEQKDVFQMSIN